MSAAEETNKIIVNSFDNFMNLFSPSIGQSVLVFIIAVLIALTALFIWFFYKSLSQKNLIGLDLAQYNRSEHPGVSKFLAILLYFLEYMVIMPFIILTWFAALSVFILIIASEREVGQILLLSAAMVAAIRILAYGHSEISKDLAKLFPFITLSIFLLTPDAFDFGNSFVRLVEIPLLIKDILYFLLVIFLIEIILRLIFTLYEYYTGHEEKLEEDN